MYIKPKKREKYNCFLVFVPKMFLAWFSSATIKAK